MDITYHQHLSLLKESFDQENESSIFAEKIISTVSSKNLKILDVGIGEGRSVLHLADQLVQAGYSVHLTGIDTCISSKLREKEGNNIELREIDFDSFKHNLKYDAVISTQSLYYLGTLEKVLTKLLGHTKRSGCLLVTTWAEGCVLRDIHNQIFSPPKTVAITAQKVAKSLNKLSNNATVTLTPSIGEVNIAKWLSSEEICKAAFEVLARASTKTILTPSLFNRFILCLESLPPLAHRKNGTVVLKWNKEIAT